MVDCLEVHWSKFLFVTLVFPWQLVLVEAEGQVNYLTLYSSEKGTSIQEGFITVEPLTEFKVIVVGENLNSSLISFSEKVKDRGKLCENFFQPIISI